MGESANKNPPSSRSRIFSAAGFSLIEVLIAGLLLTFVASALLPMIYSVGDSSKGVGFKAQCTAAVRAKLQEYLNGVADSTTWAAGTHIPTGFEYTKKRWEAYGYTACATNNPTVSNITPGYREAVYSNVAPFTGPEYQQGRSSSNCGTNITDCYAVTAGFQLYVLMRHYNPRILLNNTATRDCASQYYQFFQVGDAIEITVTGMIRTSGSIASGGRNGGLIGKLGDVGGGPNPRLTCSATEVIYPPRVPFRYYLGSDGHIRNYQSSIAYYADPNVAQIQKYASESHFRKVWVTSDTGSLSDPTVANILSFAVSPDNQWVYILRPGELARYGPCYSTATTVTIGGVPTSIGGTQNMNGTSFLGVPDCPNRPSIVSVSTAPGPDGLTWVNNALNIESIAVDFGASLSDPSDDKVYGFYNSGAGSMQTGGYTTQSGLMIATLPTTSPYNITWQESTAFALPMARPRIKGIFMSYPAPTGAATPPPPTLFFYDNTCFGSTSSSYCASIFSAGDQTMSQEMRELPTQVEALSY